MAKSTSTTDRPPAPLTEAQQDAQTLAQLEREKVEADAALLAAQKRQIGATNAVVAFRHVVAAREQNRFDAALAADPQRKRLWDDLQAKREALYGEDLVSYTERSRLHAAAEIDKQLVVLRDPEVLAALTAAQITAIRARFGLDKPAQAEPAERIFSPMGRAT